MTRARDYPRTAGIGTCRRPHGGSDPIERQEKILALLERARDGLTLREIVVWLGPAVSERQARRALERLRDKGMVSAGAGPSTRWKRTGGEDPGW